MAETKTFEDLGVLKGDEPAAPSAAPTYTQKLDTHGRAYATGKRKNAVARVWLKPGAGKITVNTKDFAQYFARPVLQMLLKQPLQAANRLSQFDVMATVSGGGLSGQAGAVRHGISKALVLLRARAPAGAQEGRLPHPRQPRGRAQEVRPDEGPPQLPVLQALTLDWRDPRGATGSPRGLADRLGQSPHPELVGGWASTETRRCPCGCSKISSPSSTSSSSTSCWRATMPSSSASPPRASARTCAPRSSSGASSAPWCCASRSPRSPPSCSPSSA